MIKKKVQINKIKKLFFKINEIQYFLPDNFEQK